MDVTQAPPAAAVAPDQGAAGNVIPDPPVVAATYAPGSLEANILAVLDASEPLVEGSESISSDDPMPSASVSDISSEATQSGNDGYLSSGSNWEGEYVIRAYSCFLFLI